LKKEQSEKFKQFINLCSNLIEVHPLNLFFHSASNIQSNVNKNSPPIVFDLWEAVLTHLIPISLLKYFRSRKNILTGNFNALIEQLSNFTEYTTQYSIKSILQSSLIGKIPDIDLERWSGFLLNFNKQVNSWVNGDWHQILSDDKQNALYQITKTHQFNHLWETAQFLSKLGYPVLCSTKMNRVWHQFIGKNNITNDYLEWVNLFQSLSLPDSEQLDIERKIDYLLSGLTINHQIEYCSGIEACNDCFLKEECHFYLTHFHIEHDNDVETQIKLDKIQLIDKQKLLLFLLKAHWQGSKNQKQYLSKYPNLEVQDLLINQNSLNDEDFFNRLAVIQNLIERDDLAPKVKEGQSFTNSESIYNYYRFTLTRKKQESFYILILDNKHRIIKLQRISQGILNKSLVHPREVFAPAIQLRAAAIVLIHNHPSGDPTPSTADINITRRLVQVGELVGISVLDHVIIGKNSYYSFVDEDRMPTN
jgi:hypothetical protein